MGRQPRQGMRWQGCRDGTVVPLRSGQHRLRGQDAGAVGAQGLAAVRLHPTPPLGAGRWQLRLHNITLGKSANHAAPFIHILQSSCIATAKLYIAIAAPPEGAQRSHPPLPWAPPTAGCLC